MPTKQPMTFEEFKSTLTARFGRVAFDERGKHGWTSVEDILDRKPGGTPGPHWCDAAPIPRTQRLLGTYDFNSAVATFFIDL
jgi:glucose/arabinose dehydrogenase